MKRLHLFAVGLALWLPPLARGFNYSDQDVLLIFRANGNDNIEFDLGGVTQFLNQTNGYRATVTNWSPDIVAGSFSLTNGLAQFAILAVTSDDDPAPRAWVSDSEPLVEVQDLTPSQWNVGLYGVIQGAGVGAQSDPSAPLNTNYDVIDPEIRWAFDYLTSNGGQTPTLIPYLGGVLKFHSTALVPAAVLFYEIRPSDVNPKPEAKLVGSFTLDGSGVLTFQAGPLLDVAQITSINTFSGVSAVTFNSKPGVKYRLRYSTQLSTGLSAWHILPGAVVGDGTPQTLQDNSAADAARFYTVESYL